MSHTDIYCELNERHCDFYQDACLACQIEALQVRVGAAQVVAEQAIAERQELLIKMADLEAERDRLADALARCVYAKGYDARMQAHAEAQDVLRALAAEPREPDPCPVCGPVCEQPGVHHR
jgi:hypothetical protein